MPAGTDPQDIYSNGRWFSRSGQPVQQYLLAQSGLPVVIPSSSAAGIQAHGTVTFDTALPTGLGTTNTRCWCFFPAGAVSGDATGGLYYCVLGSTTTATVYAGKQGGATGVTAAFTPTVPAALTAVTGSGAAYTQTISTLITLAAISVPGGAMGPNGQVAYMHQVRFSNTATGKASQVSFGSSGLGTISGFGSQDAFSGGGFITNQARQTSQAVVSSQNALPFFGGAISTAYTAIDTTASQLLTFALRLNTAASDNAVLETFSIQVLPA